MDNLVCTDAIVVIPGIMGSELVESDTGRVLWGFDVRAGWRMWTRPEGTAGLRVTSAERAGRTGRVIPRRFITAPGFAPWLGGFEPYSRLVAGIRQVAPAPEQVLEFPYDWRLAVDYNSRRLAREGAEHLWRWRRVVPGARLTLVAHSMGGLLARALALPDIAAEARHALDVGTIITMGTPFYGSVKAAVILGRGHTGGAVGAKLRRRLREVAWTMPGIYDLLPRYRCVVRENGVNELAASDIAAIGADSDLAQRALEFGELMAKVVPTQHNAIIGIEQATFQSLAIDAGTVEGLLYGYRNGANGELIKESRHGDGTVYRDSADLGVVVPLPQQHGALAKSPEAIAAVRDILTRGEHRGPRLGVGQIGIDPPDVVEPALEWAMEVAGVSSPAAARCTITDLAEPWRVTPARLECQNSKVHARIILPQPGLYRLAVRGGGGSPVTQVVAAVGRDLE